MIYFLIVVGLVLAFSAWRELRDMRNKEMLAKLMDCDYVVIWHNEYFIPRGKQ